MKKDGIIPRESGNRLESVNDKGGHSFILFDGGDSTRNDESR